MSCLNLGCGDNKIRDCINVDVNVALKPDLVANFMEPLPFEDGTIDKIYLFHVIEHIQKSFHLQLLARICNLLKPGGVFYISYPEFTVVAQHFRENYKGMREFWENTIYGRQSSPFDFHVSLMYTPHFVPKLEELGFDVESKSEAAEPWNTVCKCVKARPLVTKETIYRKHWFNAAN